MDSGRCWRACLETRREMQAAKLAPKTDRPPLASRRIAVSRLARHSKESERRRTYCCVSEAYIRTKWQSHSVLDVRGIPLFPLPSVAWQPLIVSSCSRTWSPTMLHVRNTKPHERTPITPTTQVNAVRNHGGPTVSIRLHGQNYDEAAAEANRLVHEEGLSLIHPFDDPEVGCCPLRTAFLVVVVVVVVVDGAVVGAWSLL